jgi:hypothetical protein
MQFTLRIHKYVCHRATAISIRLSVSATCSPVRQERIGVHRNMSLGVLISNEDRLEAAGNQMRTGEFLLID